MSFAKFLWIELIGFDNRQADYGVQEFLSRMPIRPQIISLLLWNTDIIHSHAGLAEDAPIGLKHCAYQARPRNEEHTIQNWTRFQLRGLITELHKAGIAVYASFFEQLISKETQRKRGIPDSDEWIDHHPEIRYICADGSQRDICIWKHLQDGTLYEDFFTRQLETFLTDYGFDGLHGADGYAHPRENISFGDFSDDMIAQFQEASGIQCPALPVPERALWIRQNAREAWTDFQTRRHAQFWRKVIAMLNRNHLGHVLNSCWTKDPFEARIFFGVDYRLLAEAGVRNFICEAQAAVLETEGWVHTGRPKQDDYRVTVQRLKSCLPQCHFYLLHCIKDGLEQYNVLHHAPMFLESDVYTLANMTDGTERILDGIMVCLADGISQSDWAKLDSLYPKAFAPQPRNCPCPRVVWSEEAHRRECQAYRFGKSPANSQRLHASLLSQGAVLPASIRIEDLPDQAAPLVILHPGFFTKDERMRIFQASNGNLAEIGFDGSPDSFLFRLTQNGCEAISFRTQLQEPNFMPEPLSWLCDLPEYTPPLDFLAKAAEELNCAFARMRPLRDATLVRLWGYDAADGLFHLFVGSEKRTYQTALVSLQGHWQCQDLLSGSLVLPPNTQFSGGETQMAVKLPPSGTVHITLKTC